MGNAEKSPLMNDKTEQSLVRQASSGDRDAFEKLVTIYGRKLYGFIYHLTGNYADADDLSQETFLRAYAALGKFNNRCSFYTWIYRIALNLTLNHLKRKKALPHFSLDADPGSLEKTPDLITAEKNPREALLLEENVQTIRRAIASLPLEQRTVITLVVLEDMSYRQAAEVSGCSQGTIAWRLYQARKKLAFELKHLKEKT